MKKNNLFHFRLVSACSMFAIGTDNCISTVSLCRNINFFITILLYEDQSSDTGLTVYFEILKKHYCTYWSDEIRAIRKAFLLPMIPKTFLDVSIDDIVLSKPSLYRSFR